MRPIPNKCSNRKEDERHYLLFAPFSVHMMDIAQDLDNAEVHGISFAR
jgi:hypothetical protein